VASLAALTLAGCGGSGGDDAAARGRIVYLAQCTACHATDPAQPGPVGPPVRGASEPLLAARILHAGYPAGYLPKRTSRLMPAMPQLRSSIRDLAAYLSR
jgi:mono/diheme cytochrome c family protein